MKTAHLLRSIGLAVIPVMATFVPASVGQRGVQPSLAACQDGTCCPEDGSTCVVGDYQRANKYYKSSGSCTDPKQPAPPP